MCSPEHISLGICVPPKGYMFPPVAVICVPQGCVPPPARASTGQTLASAGRDGSPRGRTRPSAHGRRGDESAPRMYNYSACHRDGAPVLPHGRRDATRRRANCVTCIPTCMATSLRASRSYLSAFRLPLRPSIDVVLFQMEEEKWQAIFNYVANKKYPAGYSKSQKYVLRRSCKSYVVEGGKRLFSRHL